MIPLAFVEQPIASAAMERARKRYPKFDDYWEKGISWVLARNPEKGTRVSDIYPPRYVISFNPWKAGGIPRIVVVYRHHINPGKLEIERVTFYDEEE